MVQVDEPVAEQVAQLCSFIGISEALAVKLVERYKDVETAMNMYLDDKLDLENIEAQQPEFGPLAERDIVMADSSNTDKQTSFKLGKSGQMPASQQVTSWAPPRAPPQSPSTHIDLTNDQDEASPRQDADLTRAVEMSRQQSDDELNQALALSLSDLNQQDTAQSTATSDYVNPGSSVPAAQRIRQGHSPVILRSASALQGDLAAYLQCLYAVPTWRKAVLDFRPQQDELNCRKDLSALWHGGPSPDLASETHASNDDVWAMTHTKRAFLHTREVADAIKLHSTELSKPGADAPSIIRGLHSSLVSLLGTQNGGTFDRRFSYTGMVVNASGDSLESEQAQTDNSHSVEVTDVQVETDGREPNDLYSALSRAFTLDGASGGGNMIALLTSVPDTLLVKLNRPDAIPRDRDGTGGGHEGQPFLPQKQLYLDRFMVQNGRTILSKRAAATELEAELTRLRENRNLITQQQDGQSGLERLEQARKFLEVNYGADDHERSARRKRLVDKLNQASALLNESCERNPDYNEQERARQEQLAAQYDDPSMQTVGPFALCAILMRNGLNGRGSSWAVVTDDQGSWWRINDYDIEQVSLESALSDKSGIHMNAGSTFLFYQRSSAAPQSIEVGQPLKDLVLRDNQSFAAEFPEDVAQQWHLPRPVAQPADNLLNDHAKMDSVEHIIAFNREDVSSPAAVDVIAEIDTHSSNATDERLSVFGLPQTGGTSQDLLRLRGGASEHGLMSIDQFAKDGQDHEEEDEDEDEDGLDGEDEVELGLLREMPDDWDIDLSVGKVGGLPRYLDPRSPLSVEDVACGQCGKVMPLLMQTQAARARLEEQLATCCGLHTRPEQSPEFWPEWDIICEPEPYEESYLPDDVPAVDGKTDRGDAAEPDTETGVDSAFLRFQERLERLPEQVMRFYRLPGVEQPSPLWANATPIAPGDVPSCSLCGSSRQVEFQIVSPLLNFLKDEHFTFDSLLAYTCVNSCVIQQRAGDRTGWAEEFVVRQSFADQGVRFGQT
ncbi:hypothetical protein OIO90_004415 [Microbotryomycetes sp. JL221]|nr:hypothetical protein OIO90_004415 [Microbotryomycetes sp. JL221]